MQIVTLSISDDFMAKFNALLDILPKNKVKVKIIAEDKSISNIPLSEIKYLPNKYSSPLAMNIYQDKTAIILWAKDPIAIVIKNKEITQGYKNYFELMWKIAKE
jgi:hypothetical protein